MEKFRKIAKILRIPEPQDKSISTEELFFTHKTPFYTGSLSNLVESEGTNRMYGLSALLFTLIRNNQTLLVTSWRTRCITTCSPTSSRHSLSIQTGRNWYSPPIVSCSLMRTSSVGTWCICQQERIGRNGDLSCQGFRTSQGGVNPQCLQSRQIGCKATIGQYLHWRIKKGVSAWNNKDRLNIPSKSIVRGLRNGTTLNGCAPTIVSSFQWSRTFPRTAVAHTSRTWNS